MPPMPPMTPRKNLDLSAAAGPGEPNSKADRAYAYIRRSVTEGKRAPGERLVIERLAREIDVSVVPVREAIRRLEAEGYVTYTRNIGATVARVDLDRFPETIETLAVLEGVAIALAAPHLTARDLAEARSLNQQMAEAIDPMKPRQVSALNRRFHRVLFNRCPNRHLLEMVAKEWDLLDTTRKAAFKLIPERARASVVEHEELLELIEAGRSTEKIEAFARAHRMRTARSLLKRLGDDMQTDRE
jgi:DNA-binding GntR family transcriptional regulator